MDWAHSKIGWMYGGGEAVRMDAVATVCAVSYSLFCSLPTPFSSRICTSKVASEGPRSSIVGQEAYRDGRDFKSFFF